MTDQILAPPERLAARLLAVRRLLEENGCDCDCDHHRGEHSADCEVCLACRIEKAITT